MPFIARAEAEIEVLSEMLLKGQDRFQEIERRMDAVSGSLDALEGVIRGHEKHSVGTPVYSDPMCQEVIAATLFPTLADWDIVKRVDDSTLILQNSRTFGAAQIRFGVGGPYVRMYENTYEVGQDGRYVYRWTKEQRYDHYLYSHPREFEDLGRAGVAELEDDCKTIIPGTETMCLRTSQAWEQVWGPVNEGPFILKHEGTYYLSYSANSYESQDYGIGYATSKNPKGPWEKHYGNPILQKPGMLLGTGHHAFFKDKNGKGRIAFHSHNNGREIHPRIIHIGSYGFEDVKNGDDILYIEKIYHTPGMN